METAHTPNRIHPLMAGAAVAVMLVSLLGAAAITGVLPTSHGTVAPAMAAIPTTSVATQYAAPMQTAQSEQPVVHHKTVVHHHPVTQVRPIDVAQAEPERSYTPVPVYQQPAPVRQNSPVGIGVGAVVGGLLGNQVGGGKGKTLATIAGAIGGGFVGNEIAKQY